MESDAIKMVVLAPRFVCFALVPRARSERRAPARTRERNNVVKREGGCESGQEAGQIRAEIDLITSASCRDAVFTAVRGAGRRARLRPCERKTGLRIRASANRSLDYDARDSGRRAGEDA